MCPCKRNHLPKQDCSEQAPVLQNADCTRVGAVIFAVGGAPAPKQNVLFREKRNSHSVNLFAPASGNICQNKTALSKPPPPKCCLRACGCCHVRCGGAPAKTKRSFSHSVNLVDPASGNICLSKTAPSKRMRSRLLLHHHHHHHHHTHTQCHSVTHTHTHTTTHTYTVSQCHTHTHTHTHTRTTTTTTTTTTTCAQVLSCSPCGVQGAMFSCLCYCGLLLWCAVVLCTRKTTVQTSST